MQSAHRIRKQMLALLQKTLIPSLETTADPRLILAGLPLRVPEGVGVRPLPFEPLDASQANHEFPEGFKWPEQSMRCISCPVLRCVWQGQRDMVFGVTRSMAEVARCPDAAGGYALRVTGPSWMLIPQGVPMSTGGVRPWLDNTESPDSIGTFQIRALEAGALCHMWSRRGSEREGTYSLLLPDGQLLSMLEILENELRSTTPSTSVLRAQLMVLLLRLEKGLLAQVPLMTDGLHSRFPEDSGLETVSRANADPVLSRIHNYVQMNLHEKLSPALIARQVALTPTQVNRLFRSRTGLSTMAYVKERRMDAARLLLINSELPVKDVARLVGYDDATQFSREFRGTFQISPLRYRQHQNRIASQG